MTGRIPSRGSDQFNLRFPAGMRDQIAAEAERNGRSMNTEIITRLSNSLQRSLIHDRLDTIDAALSPEERVEAFFGEVEESFNDLKVRMIGEVKSLQKVES